MLAEEKPSVLNRPPIESDCEYWLEVGTHITGILGVQDSYKFVAWMIRTPGSVDYYMLGEQARVTLLQRFMLECQ